MSVHQFQCQLVKHMQRFLPEKWLDFIQNKSNTSMTGDGATTDSLLTSDSQVDWYYDQFASQKVSANRWRLAFAGQLLVSLLLGGALMLTFPMQKTVPFPIIFNETTQTIKPLYPNQPYQPDSPQMVQNDLIRYVRARESYSPYDFNVRYRQVAYTTQDAIFSQFEQQNSKQNPLSFINILGDEGTREVKVHSVIFLDQEGNAFQAKYLDKSKNLVQVDFSTHTRRGSETKTQHWVAKIAFKYTGIPTDEIVAWENWNGFMVLSYQVLPRVV